MPKAWNDKDERQYQHVKESELKEGRSESKAEEIAARTVNKQRREEGRTQNSTVRDTGNQGKPLRDLTKEELYSRAKKQDIEGRSEMIKDELIKALGGKVSD